MLAQELERELTGRIIPFWRALRDDERGGYYGEVSSDLQVDIEAEKATLLMCRILWFFSTASRQLDDANLLDDARHAYRFIADHCFDAVDGGLFWSVDRDGRPADTTKHTYLQAFGVYALAAYFQASGDRVALGLTRELGELIEERCWDGRGYSEEHDVFFREVSNEKLAQHGVAAKHTTNTLLHLLEGYAGWYSAAGDPLAERGIRRILAIFLDELYNPDRHRLELFFDDTMTSLIDMHSLGHDIEASWLVEWAASCLGEPDERVRGMCADLAQEVYRSGFRDGSVIFESVRGTPDLSRVWWVQAEAMLGFDRASDREPLSPWAPPFARAVDELWEYIQARIVDPREKSEWLWQVDEDGRPVPTDPIAAAWKCPYHNGRACLRLIESRTAATALEAEEP